MTGYIKHLLATLVALLVSLPSWSADGDAFTANTVEGVQMTFKVISESEKTCQVDRDCISTDYEGPVTIPSSANGYTVTGISSSAFFNREGITSITIPECVTTIKYNAFAGCTGSLIVNSDIPDAEYVFKQYRSPFMGSKFSSVKVNGSYIGDHAFFNLTTISSVEFGENVENIGPYAFSGCKSIVSIKIPKNVTAIGDSAFEGCQAITSISISEGVKIMGDAAFALCTGQLLIDCDIPNGNPNLTTYPMRNSKFNSVKFNGHHIGDFAFYQCHSITSFEFGDNVETIGRAAFAYCPGLTSFTIPSKMTTIGEAAFWGSSLTSITIPSSITEIGLMAFEGCADLTSITLPPSITSIRESTFQNCKSLKSITIPESVTTIREGAFAWCPALTSITLPSSLTSIGNSAFTGCSSLTSITIPSSVTNIGDYAFEHCTSLNKINIPESVTHIGISALSGCTGIQNPVFNSKFFVKLPTSYQGSYEISESIESICGGAFFGCSGLTSITIPESVTSIGEAAFWDCVNLKNVYSHIKEPFALDATLFINILEDCELYVPKGTIDAYIQAGWSTDIFKGGIFEMDESVIEEINESFSKSNDFNVIYNLRGHKTPMLHKGLNIIISADGKTRKVIVK